MSEQQGGGTRLQLWVMAGVFALLAVVGVVVILTDSGRDPPLWVEPPHPNTEALADYETWLYEFLKDREYDASGWGRDVGDDFTRVRDTGPYLDGMSYGTHEAVRVYYSPGVMRWLERGRNGEIPDGGMIVKEMFPAPAARYSAMTGNELDAELHLWAVMVKDSRGSRDGWFWAFYNSGDDDSPAQEVDRPGDPAFTNALYPASGFGQYCTRCHSSAEAEMTFSSLRNIEGAPGIPIRFRVDDSWRKGPAKPLAALTATHDREIDDPGYDVLSAGEIAEAEDALRRFEEAFTQQQTVAEDDVVKFPNVSWDWVLPDPDGPTQFSTSVQCMSCHDGQGLPFGPNMYIPPRAESIRSPADFESAASKLSLSPEELAALAEVHAVATAWMDEVADAIETSDLDAAQAAELRALAMDSVDDLVAATGLSGDEVAAIVGHFPGFNVSPFGEWRWSMMGLAGRDPIFHAQLESEVALWEPLQAPIENLCSSCHGVMGQRLMEIDAGKTEHLSGSPSLLDDNEPLFRQGIAFVEEPDPYGALAREGISCMVCHQVVETPPEDLTGGLEGIFSGNFMLAAPEKQDGQWTNRIFGPFREVAERAIRDTLGMVPEHSAYISSARMCGSCHTVVLPILDQDGNVLDEDRKPVGNDGTPHLIYEQTTYLEWANSQYRDEFGGVDPATAAPCQACHMPGSFHDPATESDVSLEYRIANIQDDTYPEADELAPIDEITVLLREEGYTRHTLEGINLFALQMFRQFPEILGVAFGDYMTGSADGLDNAIEQGRRLAEEDSGGVEIVEVARTTDGVTAEVRVANWAGHRFPSGVGFRRLFVEFAVLDASGTPRWTSGATNTVGVIVDGEGRPLRTEFFAPDPAGGQQYQRHHEIISSQDQVQIYEELALSPEGEFTTNFLNRSVEVKDNRLLPLGWSDELWDGVTSEFTEEFLETTLPKGLAAEDGDFGAGGDTLGYAITGLPEGVLDGATVSARLYYQSIPPAYLADRFAQARKEHGQRLYYLTSHLDVEDTAIDDWKLEIGAAAALVPAG